MMIAIPSRRGRRDDQMNRNLGKTLGEVNAEVGSISAFLDDPITQQSGCADEFLPDLNRRVLARVKAILEAEGYSCFGDFLNEIELRTNPKWAYFYSGIAHFDEITGDPFWLPADLPASL